MEQVGRLDRGDGVELAWAKLAGRGPTVVFLPGFNSDMQGSKATSLRDWCAGRGRAMLRLDYSGHGASGGAFTDGSVGRWMLDAMTVIERQTLARETESDLLLVGSSMGGWIALLLARALAGRVVGLVGIAAAPDFTERLMWQSMTPGERATIARQGYLDVPSEYGAPYRVTLGLIEDGRKHLLLGASIPLTCPVRLLQGQRDADVPWETALRLAEAVVSEDVQVCLIKDGDHRLSRPQDLALLAATVGALLGEDGG